MATITASRRSTNALEGPSLFQRLFTDRRASLLWLPIRIWLGWQWIEAAQHKISDPAWTQTGVALKGYWTNAVSIPETGRAPIAFDWYRSFIQSMLDAGTYTWFAKLVVYGELLVGIALIIGAFVGIAALFGAVMNWNYMMAGSASTNPMLFVVALALIVAWKVAGYIGVDFAVFNYRQILAKVRGEQEAPATAD
ncbi:MAG TPA: DoxX family membrane protein [Aggregatilinea sp.]|jgi:thiosulfate dehydrogenase [quinone] large subunit|uniref:DoxX family membrane protein n=1 Tax=Aggregatilinea sp. TaxID=2806333 RepID=UPI002C72605E|nr:DoxX family membrane protein [Aggregatilinea sp.]HML20628.1 DoxX family membrane protein [Aggregatilinea sp.]